MTLKWAQTIAVSLFLSLSVTAHASDCDEYLLLLSKYYRLDQEFKSITCNIDSPALNESLGQIRKMLGPLQGKVDIKDSLADFTLTFSKTDGLKINKPQIEVQIISQEGITDPEKVRRGIEMMNNGFKEQIDGIAMQLDGIFEGLSPIRHTECKIDEITHQDGGHTARYERGNVLVTEILSDTQRKIKSVSKTEGETSVVENYDRIFNNKRALTSAHITSDNPMIKTEIDMSISYEDIKGVLIPTHITNHVRQYMQALQQEMQSDVYLRNCILEQD